LKHRNRFIKESLFGQDNTEIVARVGIVVLEMKSPTICGCRFVQLPPFLMRIAEIVMGLRGVGMEFERPAITGDGIVQPAERAAG